MKKVIFIGGTSFSGSTFLDMTLANDPRGFSCGEVVAMFHPYRPHHISPQCGCGDRNCNLWQLVLKSGKRNLYKKLFELFPQIDFVVDSSKDPFWIEWQTKNLKNQNISIKNILIWKTPLEYAHSLNKRNRLENLESSWITYHRLYFTLIDNWNAIRYFDFTKDSSCLKSICDFCQIPYFPGKEKYWEKTLHTLFGNTSAKIHLYSNNAKKLEEAKDELLKQHGATTRQLNDKLQTVYYESASKGLEKALGDIESSNRYFSLTQTQLDSKNLHRGGQEEKNCEYNLSNLKYNKLTVLMKLINYRYFKKVRKGGLI